MKPGDKVRFLNDVGGGTVLRVEGKTVIVSDEDGFEMPTQITNVVVIADVKENNFPMRDFEKKNTQGKENAQRSDEVLSSSAVSSQVKPDADQFRNDRSSFEARDTGGDSYEFMLAFLPPKDDKTDLYLLNDSSYRVHYLVGMYERSGSVHPLAHGVMEPDSKELVKTITLSELRDAKTLRVQVLLSKNIPYKPYDLEPAYVELNPLKFFKQGAFTENDFFEENALIYRVLSSESEEKEQLASVSAEDIERAMMQKNVEPVKSQKGKQESGIEEVDLHAEVLVPDPGRLQAGELLELQMARFTATLENALKNGRKGKIVFIHGIGSGKLKQELRNTLTRNYPKLQYQDASFKEYGYGATMVFL